MKTDGLKNPKDKSFVERNERTLAYSARVSLVLLRSLGIWPLPKEAPVLDRLRSRFTNGFCYMFFAFILIPGLLRIILIEKDMRKKVVLIGPLCTSSLNLVKYSILITKRDKIARCWQLAKEDWHRVRLDEDHEAMLSQAKVGRTLATLSVCFIYGGGLFYRTFLPLSRGKIVTADNVTIRPHAAPSYFVVFDDQKSPAYELVFFGQFVGGFVAYSVSCGACGLAAFFVMHVCGQLRILIRKMSDVVDGRYTEVVDVNERMADIVRHQIRIKRFVKLIEEMLQYVCLMEIMGCTSLVCLVLYYLVTGWEDSDAIGLVTYFLLLVSFAFNMLIYCYIGELLTNQGMKVGIASCCVDWYRLPTKTARNLILIMNMSNFPIKIVAGKLMDMSLGNFNNIIKTAVGYFNILRSNI